MKRVTREQYRAAKRQGYAGPGPNGQPYMLVYEAGVGTVWAPVVIEDSTEDGR